MRENTKPTLTVGLSYPDCCRFTRLAFPATARDSGSKDRRCWCSPVGSASTTYFVATLNSFWGPENFPLCNLNTQSLTIPAKKLDPPRARRRALWHVSVVDGTACTWNHAASLELRRSADVGQSAASPSHLRGDRALLLFGLLLPAVFADSIHLPESILEGTSGDLPRHTS
jgi:hypothetical protein